ncbi:acetolactate synthase [Novimethylophilus kurashikiensis]|uniref:Acetolactate synthase n=1 Tax=Novimethylophilus kurashikiensis TaxID=1825523 RepID=A0A2R5FDL3_9PROT|nr:hypothetical protein [Novimethylophilus kurashikiensis]GBG14644.1 acetolactate synthase [Novimethylophilus kurashikiensis]
MNKKNSEKAQLILAFLILFAITFIVMEPASLDYGNRALAFSTVAGLFAAFGSKTVADYLKSRSILIKERDDNAQRRRDETIATDFENIEVGDLKGQLDEIKGLISSIGKNELKEISDQLRASLVEGAANDLVVELKQRIDSDEQSRRFRISVNTTFNESVDRLSNEVEMLRARANTNLIIGCFIALFGAAILAIVLFFSESKFSDLSALALHMFPRLSVVVLIEVFAYFFLAMYRSNLSEIRYYQNEITNTEMKKVATLLAVRSSSTESISTELASTDRNGILKNDQTTQELERLKIEGASTKSAIDLFARLLKK